MGKAALTETELAALTEAVRTTSLSYLEYATRAEVAAGISWYATAKGYCEQIVVDHETCCSFTFEEVSGAMAILSQQNRWNQNLADTYTATNEGHTQTWNAADYGQMYHTAMAKAWDVLYGHNLGSVRGPKITSFWDNIQFPEESRKVTVDTWIMSAFGLKEAKISLGWAGVYAAIEAGVVAAADSVYLTPNALQAIIWVIIRDGKNEERN